MSKKDSNVSIHKKLLSQIVEYEHAHVKVSFMQIFVVHYILVYSYVYNLHYSFMDICHFVKQTKRFNGYKQILLELTWFSTTYNSRESRTTGMGKFVLQHGLY